MMIMVFMIIDIQYLNTNLTLYNAVLKADQDQTLTSNEAKRVAHDLRIDFEKGGIHLSAGYSLHYVALFKKLFQLSVKSLLFLASVFTNYILLYDLTSQKRKIE